MKNLILGIIIGIILIISVKTIYASNKTWKMSSIDVNVEKFTDNNISCYVTQSDVSWATAGISCVKIK